MTHRNICFLITGDSLETSWYTILGSQPSTVFVNIKKEKYDPFDHKKHFYMCMES